MQNISLSIFFSDLELQTYRCNFILIDLFLFSLDFSKKKVHWKLRCKHWSKTSTSCNEKKNALCQSRSQCPLPLGASCNKGNNKGSLGIWPLCLDLFGFLLDFFPKVKKERITSLVKKKRKDRLQLFTILHFRTKSTVFLFWCFWLRDYTPPVNNSWLSLSGGIVHGSCNSRERERA